MKVSTMKVSTMKVSTMKVSTEATTVVTDPKNWIADMLKRATTGIQNGESFTFRYDGGNYERASFNNDSGEIKVWPLPDEKKYTITQSTRSDDLHHALENGASILLEAVKNGIKAHSHFNHHADGSISASFIGNNKTLEIRKTLEN